jgi:hypothetical protein
MCSARVLGPVIQVIVPSATVPASASILGASAAIRIGQGSAPGTLRLALTWYIEPENWTFPSRIKGASTDKYSLMCEYDFAYERPSMFSITTWCERPMPSVKRLPVAALTLTACCAIANGWRG